MGASARQSLFAGKTLMQLWKQGWNEIPEIMGSSFYALIGIGCGYYGLYRYYKYDEGNHRYKYSVLIYRPDDEGVDRIRRFEDSPQPTSTPAGFTPSC